MSSAALNPSPPSADLLVPLAAHFLNCLAWSDHRRIPFDYWLLHDVLPSVLAKELAALPFPAPTGLIFNGKRETNNATRVYFTKENQENYPVCAEVVEAFNHPVLKQAIMDVTGARLAGGQLRIEYCQDIDGEQKGR